MEENILLKIRDLHIRFTQYDRGLKRRELHPVRGLSCDVEKGKLTAVVGASGSGKSLLAHAIMGILPYNCRMEGAIDYDGQWLDGRRLAALRGNEIALVPQGVSYLDPLMRAGEQIRGGRKDSAAREKCRQLLKRYGLGPETERLYPHQLSGGMARRILIASALMGDPRLIIADEPTPGLDAHTARRVAGHFKELACGGAAVLLITHDLELALECADRILIFYEGNVIEEADPGDFRAGRNLKEPYTRALYHAMPENGFQVWEEAGR